MNSDFAPQMWPQLPVLFLLEISQFQGLVGNFIEMVDSLAQQVNKEKMKVCCELVCSVVALARQNAATMWEPYRY